MIDHIIQISTSFIWIHMVIPDRSGIAMWIQMVLGKEILFRDWLYHSICQGLGRSPFPGIFWPLLKPHRTDELPKNRFKSLQWVYYWILWLRSRQLLALCLISDIQVTRPISPWWRSIWKGLHRTQHNSCLVFLQVTPKIPFFKTSMWKNLG